MQTSKSRKVEKSKQRAVTLGALLLGFAGCTAGNRDKADQAATEAGVTRTAEKGPVALSLTATPSTVDLSRHVQLRLQIVADKDVTVSYVEYERALTEGDRPFEYRAVRADRELAKPTDAGKLRWTYLYELEFFLPGEHELPSAEVSFVDVRPSPTQGNQSETSDVPTEEQTLATEPLTLVVRAPQGAELSDEELRNITRLDPIDLPRVWSRWWWLTPLIATALAVAVVLFMRRLRRQRVAIVRIPAHDWARQQLAALIAEDLIAKGRIQEFYYRVSDIVRAYIERRFGVSASEMTTEEFLATAASDTRFGQPVTDELNRFLGACDLVKYARHEPGFEESDAVLKASHDFVERTRERVMPTDSKVGPTNNDGTSPISIEERAA